ncbi:tRNA lysidine(34) synthetase TilS [Cognatiyoonia sp. IB215446]|uniref:tRNA lysidine(34) synthetase TilS n=1 Tax=Cognatiyoonia sp. IB215446 TaxID=3097355 RepID=UPI002A123934|nr:tRNA lysidine(34) synthetase TilS [Cognatiyoonia sp. IB215446]MDX8347258.1 tRNA lysidine(34) synthetase TilS [Cognatiyoonia sp. IB215446]
MSVAGTPQSELSDDDLLNAARAAFDPVLPARVAVAVSGGGDSMALLQVFAQLAKSGDLALEAVTVDHRLRPEAASEIALVARTCADLDVSHSVLNWEGWDGAGNLMAAARDARYRLIADWAVASGVDAIVFGHTADDVAENFLIRLARKAGPDGLSKMDARFDRFGVTWARPFLDYSRSELRFYLQRHGIVWAEDPTNEDDSFDRARARKALSILSDLGVTVDAINSVSGAMRSARVALDHYAQIEARRYIVQEAGDLVLRLGLTGPLPAEIKRRLWRAAIPWINGADYPPRQSALFDIVASLQSDGSATMGGCLITRKADDWRITREYSAVRDLVCKTTELWDGRWAIDGPHDDALVVSALGDGIHQCAEWREVGLPRTSLIATPAIWDGDELIAAPLAGLRNGWSAQIVADFHQHAFAH